MNIRRKRQSESGQTLILIVIALVAMLAAAFLFFDVQGMIRGKIKGQNAADAAALAGANWQKNTLNLIGELNLVKATTLLLTDSMLGVGIEPEKFTAVKAPGELSDDALLMKEIVRVEQEKNQFRTAVALLSQMQTRIAFTGPLIGFGAAQQAAKNNGLTANAASGKILYDTMYKNIQNDDLYGNELLAPQVINDYSWRLPYAAMLYSILGVGDRGSVDGIAAFTRFDFLGMPAFENSDPPNPLLPYLLSSRFYTAVAGNNWCELRSFLEASQNFGADDWWGAIELKTKNSSFLKQSEILPVHIEFFTGSAPYEQADDKGVIDRILDGRGSDGSMRKLSAVFDGKDPYSYSVSESGEITLHTQRDANGNLIVNEGDTDFRYNILPEITWALFDSEWERYDTETIRNWGQYLVGGFKPGLDYFSGALAYFETAQGMPTYTGRTGVFSAFHDIGGNKGNSLSQKMDASGKAADLAGKSMKNLSNDISATASAKPVGRITAQDGTYLAPFEAGSLVLPVFSNTALLPTALEPPQGIGMIDAGWFYFLTEYLPQLNGRSLEETWSVVSGMYPDHLGYFTFYHNALKKAQDPEWRRQGLEWLDTPVSYIRDDNGELQVLRKKKDDCEKWTSGGGNHTHHGPGSLH